MQFSSLMSILHAISAIIWVGGMFFAHMVLRPSINHIDPPQRLKMWAEVFRRFFAWVWLSLVVLLVTGYASIFVDYGGFMSASIHIHLMQGTGLVMVALFVFMFTIPYAKFRRAIAAQDWPQAAGHQAIIRRVVLTNLILGLITSMLGASGRFWA
ncbi:MAG: CopD family protein [Rhodospirillales bacterium]|nr:CopD family protein [Rhodospirillales bacterium]MCW8952411.1 CopD family protein [Rhodospirillales bacterium]MCW8969744.1 CopD family protein [Rhodospirillales bacterium]MCW9002983.1 CopD family protein [Rhodospirillales bacterium]MCW9040435.1 CopD family protein [Rhodospirillales bacterium]